MTERFRSTMMVERLDKFKAKLGLPEHAELVPAGDNKVRVHRPGFCALYAYLFTMDYLFPFLPLAEELCRRYNVWPTHLSPYVLEAVKMLAKFAELAEDWLRLRLRYATSCTFFPPFLSTDVAESSPPWGKYLVVRMEDKGSRHFWLDYFFVRTKAVVFFATGFLEAWNPICKCSCCLCFFNIFLVVAWLISFSFSVATI